ncbi:MAG: hypothetical protein Q9216_002837 [Gyalolechia sp. 2 TL-2023]
MEMGIGSPQVEGAEAKHADDEGTSRTRDAGHELARKAVEHLQQTTMSSRRLDSFEYWIRDPKLIDECEIVIYMNETKRYTLVPSQDLLAHEEDGDPGSDLFTVTWSPGSDPEQTKPIFKWEGKRADDSLVPVVTAPDVSQSAVLSMRSKASEPFLPCVFVALGSLREKDVPVSEGRMQSTYYVVLLNLSTNPVSVWLMFDYHIENDDVILGRWTNRLGDYHDRGWVREFRNGWLLPEREDRFPVPSADPTPFRDFLHRHSNLGGPLLPASEAHPAGHCPGEADSASIPQGDLPVSRQQRTCPSSNKHVVNVSHKRNSSDLTGLSQESTLIEKTDGNNDNVRTQSAGKKPTTHSQGYFGLPRHDLALLAPDIMSWSPEGFDAQQVHACLRGTHIHLGSSLRARTATEEEVDRIREDRVSFEHLRFG